MKDHSNSSVLKELQMDTMRSKKINDRNFKIAHPIEVQYSNKDTKKPFFMSCIDCSSFSEVWRFLSPHMVYITECGVACHTSPARIRFSWQFILIYSIKANFMKILQDFCFWDLHATVHWGFICRKTRYDAWIIFSSIYSNFISL